MLFPLLQCNSLVTLELLGSDLHMILMNYDSFAWYETGLRHFL